MSSGASVVFNDPRRFGYMKIIARKALDEEPLLKGLGPEPLGNEFDAAMLAHSCANRKTSLKAALLDQRVVAGLGNIYVCEALFRSQLSPRRLAATLATKKGEPTDHAKRLVTAIHAVLNQAIKAGGSSLRDHRQTSGELGYFQHSFQVYDREGEKCQTAQMQRYRQAFYPERALDFLVPEMPEVRFASLRLALTLIASEASNPACVSEGWIASSQVLPCANALRLSQAITQRKTRRTGMEIDTWT